MPALALRAALASLCWGFVGGVAFALPTEDEPQDLAAQLQVGEFADVATKAERLVERIEASTGRYDAALVVPLTLLGDARMGLDDPAGALAAYDRAKHITRIVDGLQGLAQLGLLYREARAHVASGDRAAANERHELAYSLNLREYGDDPLALLPAKYRLIEWYRYNYKFRASQVLFEEVLEVARREFPPGDPRTIAALKAYVDTFRQRRFGGREPGRGGFSAWPPGHPKDPPWRSSSSFRQGRKALREILALTEANPEATKADVAAALLELADWYQLHREYGFAMRNYRRVWALLEDDEEAREAIFQVPTPLYLPMPRNPAGPRGDAEALPRRVLRDGVVRLALTITHRGDVVGRRTLRSEPDNIMEFRVRKATKSARYRPAFHSGDPQPRRGVEIEYRYQYVPGELAAR